MYLEYLKIKNYRKFCSNGAEIFFVKKGANLSTDDNIQDTVEVQNNVASATTLIVGKNNSGKTTVAKALDLLINNGSEIQGSDFNYSYLQDYLSVFQRRDRANC